MESIRIGGKEYRLAVGYGKDDALRKSLNALTQEVFSFHFEQWYQGGYWKDQYIPYSLLDGGRVVSNVSVNPISFQVFGQERQYVELGTVMTHPDYRGQGLLRALMEKVLADYANRCDLLYLFANDSVLKFYPKFGFEELKETQCFTNIAQPCKNVPLKKLDMADEAIRAFVMEKAAHAMPVSQLSMRGNAELVMFHCTLFLKSCVYYAEPYDAVVVADYKNDEINVLDIFSPRSVPLEELLRLLQNETTRRIVLSFTPPDTAPYQARPLRGEGTLCARGKDLPLLQERAFMFPLLSHT